MTLIALSEKFKLVLRLDYALEKLVLMSADLHLCDLSALVVATQDRNSVLEAYFQCDEQSDCLDAVVAAIDVVAHEEVVGVRGLSANLEQLAQVVELAMNVTADRHRRAYLLHV